MLLVRELLARDAHMSGRELLAGALTVWLANLIVFALWFWELDRGGPRARERDDGALARLPVPADDRREGADARTGSRRFSDYLYTSSTNATAFSPTDTMPITGIGQAADVGAVALVVRARGARDGARREHPGLTFGPHLALRYRARMPHRLPCLLNDPPPAAGRTWFANARVFDGTTAPVRERAAVLVEDGRIAAIAGAGEAPPEGARVIDVEGRTLMPGLIDAHQHATAGSHYFCKSRQRGGHRGRSGPAPRAHVVAQVFRELLRMGITTFRDVGGYDDLLVEARQAMRYGAFDGPRVLACGRIVSATSPGRPLLPRHVPRGRRRATRSARPCASRCATAPTSSRS